MSKSLSLSLFTVALLFTASAQAIVRPMTPAESHCAIKVDEQLKKRYGEAAHLQFSQFKEQSKHKVFGSGQLVNVTKTLGQLSLICLIDPQTETVKRIIFRKLIKPAPSPKPASQS